MIGNGQAFLASQAFCAAFQTLAIPQRFAAGENVFVRGEPVRGVFLVASGRVSLSVDNAGTSKDAGPGSALGLPATIARTSYMLSARAMNEAELAFVPCEQFLRCLETQPELSFEVVQILGTELQYACRSVFGQVRNINSSIRASLAARQVFASHTVGHPIGLRRARKLLSELKAGFDSLSHTSRRIIVKELEVCAERPGFCGDITQERY